MDGDHKFEPAPEMIQAGVKALRNCSHNLLFHNDTKIEEIAEAIISAAIGTDTSAQSDHRITSDELIAISTTYFRSWGSDRGIGEAGALGFCEELQRQGIIFVRSSIE